MSTPRQDFRRALSGDAPVLAANIFDPLSARIAQLLGYSVCVLSGSVAKAASLAVPDLVLANMSDLADQCRRIMRAAPVSLMVDAEDGYGGAVNVMRTVADLEAAGVSAIEIEDNAVPRRFGVVDPGLVSVEEQVGKLRAALDARSDPDLVIVARTAALRECPRDEAMARIAAYTETGADAVMLAGVPGGRDDIEAVHRAIPLPLCVLSPPPDARDDAAFLAANNVRIVMLGNPAYAAAVRAVHDVLAHLRDGGSLEALGDRLAPADLLAQVIRTEEFVRRQREYGIDE